MNFINLNIYSTLFFVSILGFLIYLIIRNYKANNKTKKGVFLKTKIFYFRVFLLFLSFFIIFLSIFGPKFVDFSAKTDGIDIVFVLDVSKSMNAYDIEGQNGKYSRIDFSKKVIADFVLKNPNNRYSLIIFSGEAKISIPLTFDSNLFLTFLQNADYKNFEKQGSALNEALELAKQRFFEKEKSSKAIVLISDGGDDFDEINKNLLSKNLDDFSKFFVIGVGTETGAKIPTGQDLWGTITYQKYNGQDVIVSLNKKNLKDISDSLKAEFLVIEKIGDLDKIDNSLQDFSKNIYEINNLSSSKSYSRNLAIFSFLVFLLFMFTFIFDFKKYEK